jgi:hypothetical protein
MSKAPIAPDIHQALDVHGGFSTQITLNCELGDFITNFFQL